MYSNIGMTGTRNGMTVKQKSTFKRLLLQFEADWLHHGDCVGADSESHSIAAIAVKYTDALIEELNKGMGRIRGGVD